MAAGDIDPGVLAALKNMGVSAEEAAAAMRKMGDAMQGINPDTPDILMMQLIDALKGMVLAEERKRVRNRHGGQDEKVVGSATIIDFIVEEFEVAVDGVIGATFTIHFKENVPAKISHIEEPLAGAIGLAIPYDPEVDIHELKFDRKGARAFGRLILRPNPETPLDLLPDGLPDPQPKRSKKRRHLDL